MVNQDNSNRLPRNTGIVPLAREIPEHRQARLAGRQYLGPITNITPNWYRYRLSGIPTGLSPTDSIKGQRIISTGRQETSPSVTSPIVSRPTVSSKPFPEFKNTLSFETEKINQQIAEKEAELARHQEQNANLSTQIVELQNTHRTSQAVIKNLRQKLNNLQSSQTDQEELAKLKKQIDNKELESTKLRDEMARLNTRLVAENKLADEIKSYRQQVRDLTRQQEKLQSLVTAEQDKLKQLSQQLEQKEIESQSKESQIKKLEKILDETIKSSSNQPKTINKTVQAKKLPAEQTPILTKTPNAISGVVKDKDGKLITGVVIIIKDHAQHNLRALRTNSLGQFIVTTPLGNGTYFIEASYPKLSFDLIEIELTGGVIPPISIHSYEPLS